MFIVFCVVFIRVIFEVCTKKEKKGRKIMKKNIRREKIYCEYVISALRVYKKGYIKTYVYVNTEGVSQRCSTLRTKN